VTLSHGGFPGVRLAPGWYGGGKLAADLTLPKLRGRWAGPAEERAPFGGADFPAAVVRGALRTLVSQAAEQATGEAGFFAAASSRRDRPAAVQRDRSGTGDRVRGRAPRAHRTLRSTVVVRGRAAGRRAHPAPPAGTLAPAHRRVGGTPGAPRFTAPERDEIYRHAARRAAAATEHIRRCAVSDPARAADAAWAAADTLHAAARALRNPHLRCAADSYDRAARAQHGRLPPSSHDGDQPRRTARLIALAGNLTGE
jgi:hypothetical protein